jgi:hypothetical protein
LISPVLLLCFDLGILGSDFIFLREWGQILKKFLFFRHLLLFILACLNVFGFDFQDWIQFILQKVGSEVT